MAEAKQSALAVDDRDPHTQRAEITPATMAMSQALLSDSSGVRSCSTCAQYMSQPEIACASASAIVVRSSPHAPRQRREVRGDVVLEAVSQM